MAYTGSSDPYFLVSLDDQLSSTRIIPRDLNPKYEETFNFQIKNDHNVIRIKGYDKDVTFSDDLLGELELEIELRNYEPVDAWHPLRNTTSGALRIFYVYINLENR